MADIVLSYARETRPQAESLAGALESAGWSVWWDRAILPGVSYEQVSRPRSPLPVVSSCCP